MSPATRSLNARSRTRLLRVTRADSSSTVFRSASMARWALLDWWARSRNSGVRSLSCGRVIPAAW